MWRRTATIIQAAPVGATLPAPHSCMRPRALWIRERISSRRSQRHCTAIGRLSVDVLVRSGYATVIVYSVREMDQNKA